MFSADRLALQFPAATPPRQLLLLLDDHLFADAVAGIVELFVHDRSAFAFLDSFERYTNVLLPADVLFPFRWFRTHVTGLSFLSEFVKNENDY